MSRPLLATLLVALVVLPTFGSPPAWAARDSPDSAYVRQRFFADGGLSEADLASSPDPLAAVSFHERTVAFTSAVGVEQMLEITAIGVGVTDDPLAPRWHTLDAQRDEAPDSDLTLFLLCRAWVAENAAGCAPALTSIQIAVKVAPYTTAAAFTSAHTGDVLAPTWNPTASPSRFAYDAAVALYEKIDVTLVPLPPVEVEGATGATAFPYRFTLPLAANDPAVVYAEGSVAFGGKKLHFREPIARTVEAEPAQVCLKPFPGADALPSYGPSISLARQSPAYPWLSSCRPFSEVQTISWQELLEDPTLRGLLDDASRTGTSTALDAIGARLATHHVVIGAPATGPAVNAVPTDCLGNIPCLRHLPLSAPPSGVSVTWEVRDGEAWVPAEDPTAVFGGHSRLHLDMPGIRGLDGVIEQDPLNLAIEIVPSAPEVDAVGIRIQRPGDDARLATAASFPAENLLGGTPRVSSVPMLTLGDQSAPFMVDSFDDGVATLEACVRSVASHNDHGLSPNFLLNGAPADRLALPSAAAECLGLGAFVDLTLPAIGLGIMLEVELGSGYGIELEVAKLGAEASLAGWTAGIDTQNGMNATGDLVDRRPHPWEPGNPAFESIGLRGHARLPRLHVTLPRTLPAPVVSDAAILLTYLLRDVVVTAAVLVDDLPITPLGALLLDDLETICKEQDLSFPAILVPTGVLPESARLLPHAEKLMSIQGLAASAHVITIGAGSSAGVASWSRQGPTVDLRPKPDFLAPAVAGITLNAVSNVLPLVEYLELGGIQGSEVIRATLAAIARPTEDAARTFYQEGYGLIDLTVLLEEINIVPPDLSTLKALADAVQTRSVHEVLPAFPPRPATADLPEVYSGHVVFHKDETYLVQAHTALGIHDVLRVDRGGATFTILPVSPAISGSTVSYGAPVVGSRVFTHWGGKTVAAYDLASLTAQTFELPEGLAAPAVVGDEDHVYVVGGYRTGVGLTSAVRRLDPIAGTWTTVGELPSGAAEGAAAFAHGILYFLGGSDPQGFRSNDIQWVDLATGSRGELLDALPRYVRGAEAFFDGRYIHVVERGGGTIRFDPATGIATEDATLPGGSRAAGWAGDRLLAFIGGERSLYEFGPGTIFPAADGDGDLRNAARSAQSTNAIIGLTIPPGMLDPIQIGVPTLHIDTPLLPGVLLTDWGVTDHEVPKAMAFRALDVEAGLAAAYREIEPTFDEVRALSTVRGIVSPIIDLDLDLTFAGPDEAEVHTSHYYVFDLIASDMLLGFTKQLLDEAARVDPGRELQAPLDEIARLPGARLPKPYSLVQNISREVEAVPRVTNKPRCVELSEYRKFAEDVAKFIDSSKDVTKAAPGGGVGALSQQDMQWLQAKTFENTAFTGTSDHVCAATSLVWVATYLHFLRDELAELSRIRHTLGDVSMWACNDRVAARPLRGLDDTYDAQSDHLPAVPRPVGRGAHARCHRPHPIAPVEQSHPSDARGRP